MSYPPQGAIAGDMLKATYDPDADGKLALAQLVSAVCSETEAGTIADISPSETLRNSNDPEKTTGSTSWTKIKEVLLNADIAACRLKFDGHCATETYEVKARIYKNDSPLGIERSITNVGYETISEDFAGWSSGDRIQIYGNATVGGRTTYVRNMRFCYSEVVETIRGKTLATLVETTTDPTISMTNQDP